MSLEQILPLVREGAEYRKGEAALQQERPVWIEGLAGAAKTAVAGALARGLERPLLYLTADESAAEQVCGDLAVFGYRPEQVGLYPASEPDLTEALPEAKVAASSAEPERRALARTRLAVLEGLSEGRLQAVVAPIQAALRATIGPLREQRFRVAKGETLDLESASRRLVELGYERAAQVEVPGQFAVRGGILDVFPATAPGPVRIELLGDEVESVREFDADTQRSQRTLERATMLPAAELLEAPASESGTYTLLEHLPPGTIVLLDEPNHLRARWLEFKEGLERQAELVRDSDTVRPEHVAPESRAHFLELEPFLRRLEPFRRVVFTLLAHTMPWLRRLLEDAERLAINSGAVDSVNGDVPELATRIRGWLSGGHRVAIASDQPHRITELLAGNDLPVQEHRPAEQRTDSREGEGPPQPGALAPTAAGAWEGGNERSEGSPAEPGALAPTWEGEPERPVGDRPGSGGPSPSQEMLPSLLEPRVVAVFAGRLSGGFWLPGVRLYVLSDAEILGHPERRAGGERLTRRLKEGRPILSLAELREGDLVVHVQHGIGRYRGLVRRLANGIEREFLRIDYQEPDKLFVPSEQLDRVQKYIGSDDAPPTLHRLGGGEWFRTKSRVRARVKEMAKELLQLYAARQAAVGHSFGQDTVWQQELEAAFPYRETGDQLEAIIEVKHDMETAKPMDRLVCGDVGYGKTEVAIRAAFKAVVDGKQVAVLCPTTILAQQHFQTFSERMAPYPIRVEVISRFRSPKEQKQVVADLATGLVDVVIGTHRLLSKDVSFRDLGLLVVDEEQRFGVGHKERLKQLRKNVDVVTLTATPIPRTLHMSLSGIRDMSVIEDPPEGRLSVRTYCLERDPGVLREALLRELDRGGQVYYVHNRIDSIHGEADRLGQLVPQARTRIGHGQMADSDLEEVMLDFYDQQFDVLVCTTIIENGLDVPNANTMIVNDADHLGLAQLHQLRGRIGRSARQAYCYLFYQPFKELTETAERRLQAVREFTDLGAGFRIALRDLEIRGAGNLLGAEQHGFMVAVGFDLYCQMIEEEIKQLKGEETKEQLLPAVGLPVAATIPGSYIPTDGLRIAFYKKIAACREPEDVAKVQAELEDRFGDPPQQVWNLLALMRLRMACVAAGVARVEAGTGASQGTVTLWLARRMDLNEQKELMRTFRRAQFLPDRILLHYDGPNPLRVVENLVAALEKRGGPGAAQAVQRQLAAAAAVEGHGAKTKVAAGVR